MERYKCQVCGYIYDPVAGEPENGIKPGTSFNDLPADYLCPLCYAGKDDFIVSD
jgi:rubredoxin